MTLPVPSSFSGKAQATVLSADVSDVATSFTVDAISTWTETVGSYIGEPLGISGPFVLTLDYGLGSTLEEKVLCTGISGTTVYVYNSGGETGRGYDGTSAAGHSASAAGPVIHTYSADVPNQANLGVTNAAAAQATADTAQSTANTAQSTANAAQTTANNSQVPSTAGSIAIKTTYPTLPQALRVVGWTQNVAATSGGTGISIPVGFTKVLLSVVGAYANEATVAGGFRIVVDNNGSTASDSFKAWIYNSSGTKLTTGSYLFSFVAVGY